MREGSDHATPCTRQDMPDILFIYYIHWILLPYTPPACAQRRIKSTAFQTEFVDSSKRTMWDPEANISFQYFVLISVSRASPISGLMLSHIVVTRMILEEKSIWVPQSLRNAVIVLADAAIRLSLILWRYRIPVACGTLLPETSSGVVEHQEDRHLH